MSQLLVRIAKLSSSSIWKKKYGLCFSELRSLSTAATPYLLFEETEKEATNPSGEPLVELNLYDPRKDETVIIPDRTLTKELLDSSVEGSSRGWMVAEHLKDSTLRPTNMYNPCAPSSSRKVISLPPTKECVWRFSLSASPDQEDCVVAALSTDSHLIVCRPGDSEWTTIKTPFVVSGMIYSERDGKFYLGRVRYGEYDGPVDLVDTSSGFPQVSMYQEFPLSGIPKSRLEQLPSISKTEHVVKLPSQEYFIIKSEHIVESPCGESFIVYWFNHEDYDKEFKDKENQSSIKIKPKGFVVFRQDPEQKISSYTEDIGDLCIFLGENEAFCVSATECPGLKPNSIYFVDFYTGYGFYDLSSNTFHEVVNPPPFDYCGHWLPPSPMK